MDALNIKNLSKSYNGKKVLDDINLNIGKGDFFGLLGHNGAGKTTMIGIMTDLVNKDSGTVQVFGHDIDSDFTGAKSQIGVVPQEFNFDIFMKAFDIAVVNAGYYGLSIGEAKQKAEVLFRQLQLWDKKDTPSRALSGGMKRRLMIARALMHNPKLLILDEPTAGVDVELRKSMWDFLVDLNKSGTTILLTTHYLEEAESLCNKIAIINNGKIIENLPKNKLLSKLKQENIILDIDGNMSEIPQSLVKFNPILTKEGKIEVLYDNEKYNINDIVLAFDEQGIKIKNITNKTNRLEQLFIKLTKNV